MRKVVCLLLTLSGTLAFGQYYSCKICYYDNRQCAGYFASQPCVRSQICNECARTKTPFLRSSSPGILLEQRSGKLLVRKVIVNSPAERAGVQVGDELLSINGKTAGGYSCGIRWADDEGQAAIAVRRGTERMQLQMPTLSISSMVESRGLVLASGEKPTPFVLEAPFTFGFRWEEHPGYVQVSRVLAGSPAEGAGLKVGDKIVSVNGVPFAKADPIDASWLRDGYVPARIAIDTIDGVTRRRATLRSRGIADILLSPAVESGLRWEQRAGLNLSTP